MDMLVDFIPVCQAYQSIKHIGLRREFHVHFGPRVAACRIKNVRGSEEVIFWVNLVQKQLQQAINRERIWSRLTTSESIEVSANGLCENLEYSWGFSFFQVKPVNLFYAQV